MVWYIFLIRLWWLCKFGSFNYIPVPIPLSIPWNYSLDSSIISLQTVFYRTCLCNLFWTDHCDGPNVPLFIHTLHTRKMMRNMILIYIYCRMPEGRGLHRMPPDLFRPRRDTVRNPVVLIKVDQTFKPTTYIQTNGLSKVNRYNHRSYLY